jgi:hypothetical protein
MSRLSKVPGDQDALAIMALTLREVGREAEADRLIDTQVWLKRYPIAAPSGYRTIQKFNAALEVHVRAQLRSLAVASGPARSGWHRPCERTVPGMCTPWTMVATGPLYGLRTPASLPPKKRTPTLVTTCASCAALFTPFAQITLIGQIPRGCLVAPRTGMRQGYRPSAHAQTCGATAAAKIGVIKMKIKR